MKVTLKEPRSAFGKPWEAPESSIDRKIFFPQGMLGSEERQALFWFGRDWVDGRGHVIDAGAFIGTSAYSLAAGLEASSSSAVRRTRVHSYDMFVAFEDYTYDHLVKAFGHDSSRSFLDIFEYQLGEHLSRVVVHQGDLLAQRWTGEPIEILFIDIAKSHALHQHIIEQYFPHLIPGHSVVLHQDFFLSRHPWIHATMELLAEEFEVLDPIIKWCTRAYFMRSAIPLEKLSRLVPYSLSFEEERGLLQRAQEKESGPCRQLYDLLFAHQSLAAGLYDDAQVRLESFEASGDPDLVNMLHSEQAYMIKWLTAARST